MADILNKQILGVKTEGELVVLKIGSTEIKMEYETAIQLSTWLRVNGKKAKLAAGDVSRRWTVIGNLTAAEAGERPW